MAKSFDLIAEIEYIGINVVNHILTGHDSYSEGTWKNKYRITDHVDPKQLAGKCDAGAWLFQIYFTDHMKSKYGINAEVTIIHGELSHCSRWPSFYWPAQHTMNMVRINHQRYYVDCTGYQFHDLTGIPVLITCRHDCPSWFYPDRHNPSYWKIGKLLNKIGIVTTVPNENGSKMRVRLGLVEYFQYKIHGSICDKQYNKRLKGD